MVVAKQRHVLLERLTKGTFGVGKPAERCQRDREVVREIRHRHGVWPKHLPAHGDGLPLHGLGLRMRVHVAKQRRVVVHQG